MQKKNSDAGITLSSYSRGIWTRILMWGFKCTRTELLSYKIETRILCLEDPANLHNFVSDHHDGATGSRRQIDWEGLITCIFTRDLRGLKFLCATYNSTSCKQCQESICDSGSTQRCHQAHGVCMVYLWLRQKESRSMDGPFGNVSHTTPKHMKKSIAEASWSVRQSHSQLSLRFSRTNSTLPY